ncbi:MAG: hypothetical protein HOV87_33545 [Catenulispora sp.]|nr:hypothetical protein [Catenulispora sp.]
MLSLSNFAKFVNAGCRPHQRTGTGSAPRSAAPSPRGPLVTSWDDQLKAVSTGAAAIATVAEAAHFYPWPNLVFIPIRDAPAVEWALAWRTATESPLIRAFAAAVTQPRPREA